MVGEMVPRILTDRPNIIGWQVVAIKHALLNRHVLTALKLAEAPNSEIELLFKIERTFRIPNKRVVRPQLALRTLAYSFFVRIVSVVGNNNMRPEVKVVQHVIS